jgi:GTP diphosphokinase / guanosine-3',5'-bis(diphosphate) 3'-diphosphatase
VTTLERAIQIAAKAHTGQLDKAGQPYILHPLRLMFAVNDMNEKIVSVLHDVVEDTSVTLEDLLSEGFSQDIVDAVEALTKREGESRLEAAARVTQNKIALVVKLADVNDNMDLKRIPNLTEKDFMRLKEYQQVKALLLKHQSS